MFASMTDFLSNKKTDPHNQTVFTKDAQVIKRVKKGYFNYVNNQIKDKNYSDTP